jgi:hypothetical protein
MVNIEPDSEPMTSVFPKFIRSINMRNAGENLWRESVPQECFFGNTPGKNRKAACLGEYFFIACLTWSVNVGTRRKGSCHLRRDWCFRMSTGMFTESGA